MFSSNTSAANGAANYIEDVFSTYLYTGTGASQTQTNNIDLSGKGGLVWIKKRNAAESNYLQDSSSSFANSLVSNTTAAALVSSGIITSVSSTGFTTSSVSSGTSYASWTFREQAKFFDVVTYTGNGTSSNIVSHALASQPAFIITKRTDSTGQWIIWHRTGTTWLVGYLNTTDPLASAGSINASVTSTQVNIGSVNATSGENANISGASYVMYLFAHDAGGFGLTGTDNVISCGSYTGNGSTSGPAVTLGYEPQYVMIKNATAAGNWGMYDVMRGIPTGNSTALLSANTTAAETTASGNLFDVTATGFQLKTTSAVVNTSGATYIYIAIRRGPMKVPTSGTSVFSPIAANNAQGTQNTTGFPVDLQVQAWRGGVNSRTVVDRLRGVSTTATNTEKYLTTNTSDVETSGTSLTQYWNNTGFQTPSGFAGFSEIYWNFRRAPGFFDEVCYTGTGTNGQTYSHNLGVAPQLMLFKERAVNAQNWWAYVASLGADNNLILNSTSAAFTGSNLVNGTNPTASVFTTGPNTYNNQSGQTYVAYLFTTLAGVSKVGSYTGTGALLTVDCGFTSGARFIMIKRTDSTGGWYVWDSARGISSGNDPYILWNSTASEETTFNYVDTDSTGFKVTAAAPANLNASGGNYIFLAIA